MTMKGQADRHTDKRMNLQETIILVNKRQAGETDIRRGGG